jgi:hypothetical protein
MQNQMLTHTGGVAPIGLFRMLFVVPDPRWGTPVFTLAAFSSSAFLRNGSTKAVSTKCYKISIIERKSSTPAFFFLTESANIPEFH